LVCFSEDCADNPGSFEDLNGDERSCAWVFENKIRCNRHFGHCPKTCGVCEDSNQLDKLSTTEFNHLTDLIYYDDEYYYNSRSSTQDVEHESHTAP